MLSLYTIYTCMVLDVDVVSDDTVLKIYIIYSYILYNIQRAFQVFIIATDFNEYMMEEGILFYYSLKNIIWLFLIQLYIVLSKAKNVVGESFDYVLHRPMSPTITSV